VPAVATIAQFKSGLAARPTRLKPAENRGLFEEEAPETGSLFDQYRPSKEDDDVYFGSGLGALEPFFREAKKEGDRLRLERSAALAAATKQAAQLEAGSLCNQIAHLDNFGKRNLHVDRTPLCFRERQFYDQKADGRYERATRYC
jgi:hypothetical protein